LGALEVSELGFGTLSFASTYSPASTNLKGFSDSLRRQYGRRRQ
jgi:hypothetical protein